MTTVAKVPKFLRCLYEMLQNEHTSILAWSNDGTSFQVLDVARLEAHVLPKYFKHNKFTSLQRQLNNFGFRKWTKTRAAVCTFSHDTLRQCHPAQLAQLVQSTTPIPTATATALSPAEARASLKRPRVAASPTSTDHGVIIDASLDLVLDIVSDPWDLLNEDDVTIPTKKCKTFADICSFTPVSDDNELLLSLDFPVVDLEDLDWSQVADTDAALDLSVYLDEREFEDWQVDPLLADCLSD